MQVRVFVRNTGTHTGPLDVGAAVVPPSGKSYEGTTEAIAITLDDASAKVRKLTPCTRNPHARPFVGASHGRSWNH